MAAAAMWARPSGANAWAKPCHECDRVPLLDLSGGRNCPPSTVWPSRVTWQGSRLESQAMAGGGFEAGSQPTEFVWLNDRIVPAAEVRLSHREAAVFATSGVFEGIRGVWSDEAANVHLFRLDDHIARLRQSAHSLDIDLATVLASLRSAPVELLRANSIRHDCYVRMSIFLRSESADFVSPGGETTLLVEAWRSEYGPAIPDGITVGFTSWIRADNAAPLCRIKSYANYEFGRLASTETKANGFDTALILNSQGRISEGIGANFFMVKNTALYTPPLSAGALDGITRDTVLKIAREGERLGDVDVRDLDQIEVQSADEAFFTGTAWNIRPITAVNRKRLGHGGCGPVTSAISAEYRDILLGRSRFSEGWLTPIWP